MITYVEKDSIAQELGIAPGDELLLINGKPVRDVLDYRYLIKDEYLEALIRKPDGEEWELEIEKDEDEDLGLVFETGLMDKPRVCKNKCIFCFVDQLPPGLRETLYFKDDDARLGFLQGNYVTLTNTGDDELERIIYYHLSPLNISVQAADSELRTYMLKNPNASRLPAQLEKLYNAGIEMNYQIVLCKGVNDGDKLDETISMLSRYIPRARSLSVVPVGLSKFREGLPSLKPFTPADALAVVRQTEGWQHRLKAEKSTAFVFAADEFYLLAGRKIPSAAAYEGFPQLENGVGMLALFKNEFTRALRSRKTPPAQALTIVTGIAAYEFMTDLTQTLTRKFPALDIEVVAVENEFLGKSITVSGLLTGEDILKALKGRVQGRRVLLPANALRADDSVFLDDMDISTLSRELGTKVEAVETDGYRFIKTL